MRVYKLQNVFVEKKEKLSLNYSQHPHLSGAPFLGYMEWSGGAMELGKLPVPGRPTDLDYSRARAYCACSRCGWGLFGHCFSRLSVLFFFSFFGRWVVRWCWVNFQCRGVLQFGL